MPKVRMDAIKKVREGWSIRQTARYFGVEPSTISRWNKRAPQHGNSIIPTLSSRPHSHPNELSDDVIKAILDYRRRYNRCAEVIHHFLQKDEVAVSLSSVKRTLRRNGMTYPSKWKKWHTYPPRPKAENPGILVEIDTVHIGEHPNRIYVYTLLDVCSRWAHALPSERISTHNSMRFIKQAQAVSPFQFQTIQSDHGPEFSKWLTKMINVHGLSHRHSRVRTPTDNGHLERFNRTIQDECLSHIPKKLSVYKKEIPEYIYYYNNERPHMALDMKTPIEVLRRY